jgi:energy-coupling factor transport system substrate-specific component
MTALVAAVTLFVARIPVGVGYFNVSDAAIYFIAFTFGPWIGLLAGGIGTAIADLLGGYAAFAPLTFFAHGLQGFLAGYVVLKLRGGRVTRMIAGAVAGSIAMVGIYFAGEYFGAAFGWGGPAAAVTELPANVLQNVLGAAVAIPLSLLMLRAYPPIARYTNPELRAASYDAAPPDDRPAP